MNSKQLFFFSLLLLSVAMGMHWFKNRPKTKPVSKNRPRVALNLSDLQLQDEGQQSSTGEGEIAGEGEIPIEPGEGEVASDTGEIVDGEPVTDPSASGTTDLASATTDLASGSTDVTDPMLNDPIILALKSMPRNPFERSPYAQLVEQLRMASDIPPEEEEKKIVSLLTANFSATIKTSTELVAVIDSRLYRKGDLFQEKKISEITTELVSLKANGAVFLIPKTGVTVNIAEDGTYSVVDSFQKN